MNLPNDIEMIVEAMNSHMEYSHKENKFTDSISRDQQNSVNQAQPGLQPRAHPLIKEEHCLNKNFDKNHKGP